MKRIVMTLVTAASLALAIPALAPRIAVGGEEKVKEADVPRCVVDAVKKKYPKATVKGYSKETDDKEKKTIYEASIEDGTRRIDIDLSAEGRILVEEETIKAEDAPEKVRKALAASKYAKFDVKKCEKITKEEKEETAVYEYVFQSSDSKWEVVFDKDGKIAKEEEKKLKKKEDKKEEKEDKEDDDD
ncbi:PepSY-like domain-containing protein [bacterium]|nr:PepSY-like domain-containing protein [bacterium]